MTTVLLVDDDPAVTRGLERMLRNEPYVVLIANDPADALALMESSPVDVVVSDETMPGMSGSELLAIVRAKYPTCIRMMLTGDSTLTSSVRIIRDGAPYRFLCKPVSRDELTSALRQATERKDLEDRLQKLRAC
jgi:DNA-binding NtrC family response regulator